MKRNTFNKTQSWQIAALAMFLTVPPAMARPGPGGPPPLEPLIEYLQLRDDQIEPVREILAAQHAERRSFNEESRAATLQALVSVLDEEQLTRFEAMPPPRPRGRRGDQGRKGEQQ